MRQFNLPLAMLALSLVSGCTGDVSAPPPAAAELQIVELAAGDGVEAVDGRTAVVHYTGWLYDPSAADGKGAKFDSSVDRGQPFRFPVGGGRVIRGWDVGIAGMKAGGQRRLIIPAAMAYGQRGAGRAIPPNATLVFDVELLDVE
jgi:FKBP-type peptidyl-prolyl cis-trans isomerase